MTTLFTVLVILVFVALLVAFYQMQKRHVKFSNRVFAGLGAGIVFGGVLQLLLGNGSKVISVNGSKLFNSATDFILHPNQCLC